MEWDLKWEQDHDLGKNFFTNTCLSGAFGERIIWKINQVSSLVRLQMVFLKSTQKSCLFQSVNFYIRRILRAWGFYYLRKNFLVREMHRRSNMRQLGAMIDGLTVVKFPSVWSLWLRQSSSKNNIKHAIDEFYNKESRNNTRMMKDDKNLLNHFSNEKTLLANLSWNGFGDIVYLVLQTEKS